MATPIISVQQMRAWEDASWQAGRVQAEVIRTVGQIVARRVLETTRENDRILILAGKGHNGDDAQAALPHLLQRNVTLLDVNDPKETLQALLGHLARKPVVIVDALFGIGLNRPLSPAWIELIEAINCEKGFVVSVDVPSGLNADNGEPEGAAIKADITLTLGAVKRGLITESAFGYVGRLELAKEIGLIRCPISEGALFWNDPEDFADFPPRRAVSSHKGTFGHIGIIAGSHGYHGAAVLSARGAQRAQPGLITVCTDSSAYVPVASQLQAPMVHSWPPVVRLEEICSAIVAGPGLASPTLSPEIKTTVQNLWRKFPKPVVIDASALDWLEPGASDKDFLRVITPHPGEAARLLACASNKIQEDRPAAVRALSERFGNCWVILKGHQTLIGRATGPIHVNGSGNPRLAQGGSGDLLAGFIGGLLAQAALRRDPELTLRYAVWTHGAAADRLTKLKRNWTIEELAEELGK